MQYILYPFCIARSLRHAKLSGSMNILPYDKFDTVYHSVRFKCSKPYAGALLVLMCTGLKQGFCK